MKKTRLLFICWLIASSTYGSEDAGYKLYPVAAVFAATDVGAGAASKIDPDFSSGVPGGIGGKFFDEKFRAVFPEAVQIIDDSNKRRTFAVSLQVVRASKYLVKKPDGTVDVYLPITGSIYFTNIMTGEVLFTSTITEIKIASLVSDAATAGSEKIKTLFRQNFEEVVSTLVADARKKFHPNTIGATVRNEWKDLVILDSGSEQGINRDDTMVSQKGDELSIISAGQNYALGKIQLGNSARGSSFSKVSNQTLAEIRKPRVLPLIDRAPQEFAEQTLVQLLSDALGAKSPISLIPVNRTYQSVLATIAAKANISQEQVRKRELPNFFFRLNIPDPIEYEVPTNLSYKTKHIYEAIALGELVDRSGRVLFAGIGRDRIEDEVTSGISFDPLSRKEVVIKNALNDLANRFGAEMRFANIELPVTHGGQQLELRDDLGILAAGASSRVYHSIGNVDGIKGEVRVPTWDINVSEVTTERVLANTDLPIVNGAPEPSLGDIVLANSVAGQKLSTKKRFSPCAEQKLGTIDIPGYGDIAQSIFASRFTAAYFSPGLGAKVGELVRAGSGFKDDLKFSDIPTDYCVEPVYRVDLVDPKCVGEACADVSTIRLTYRIRIGGVTGDVKARQGLETKMTGAMLPKSTPSDAKSASLRVDILDEVIKLDTNIISTLNNEVY